MAIIFLAVLVIGAMIGAIINSNVDSERERFLNGALDSVFYERYLSLNNLEDCKEVREQYAMYIYGK